MILVGPVQHAAWVALAEVRWKRPIAKKKARPPRRAADQFLSLGIRLPPIHADTLPFRGGR